MWNEIPQAAYKSAITAMVPVAGGALFSGGEFAEYGNGGVAMLRVERTMGVSRYYEFVPTAR